MHIAMFEARNHNALIAIDGAISAIAAVVPIPPEAALLLKTIKPGDKDTYSLYHREALVAVLDAVCKHLGVERVTSEPMVDVVAVQAEVSASYRPPEAVQAHHPLGVARAQEGHVIGE